MAQWINWGDGRNGSPNSISGVINTYATVTASSGSKTVTTSLSVTIGDQVLLHQTQHPSLAGTWEIVKVASNGSGNFTTVNDLINSYYSGAQAVRIPQYTGGNISGSVTASSWNGSTGGIIALMSDGDSTISGSLSVNATGFMGGTGGQVGNVGYTGEGNIGAKVLSWSANGNAGGGGGSGAGSGSPNPGAGGGGGGNGTGGNGTSNISGSGGTAKGATGGGTSGVAGLTTMVFGGAGGSGGTQFTQCNGNEWLYGGAGGAGGGIILVIAKRITITGTLTANGGNGTSSGTAAGGGGGGAGGSILIKTQVGELGTNKITVSAGVGGAATSRCGGTGGAGGAGGVGRIRCDYFTSVSGITTPTLSSAKDTTLNVASGNFIPFFM